MRLTISSDSDFAAMELSGAVCSLIWYLPWYLLGPLSARYRLSPPPSRCRVDTRPPVIHPMVRSVSGAGPHSYRVYRAERPYRVEKGPSERGRSGIGPTAGGGRRYRPDRV
jgi:hypothetical protein